MYHHKSFLHLVLLIALSVTTITAYAQTSVSYLIEANLLSNLNLLCGRILPENQVIVIRNVAVASFVTPWMLGFESSDAQFTAMLRYPSSEQLKYVEQETIKLTYENTAMKQRIFQEGVITHCSTTLSTQAATFVNKVNTNQVAANAVRMVAIMTNAHCPGLGMCR
jgi:hypothetical protein